ncbi:riboflavin transporter 2 [Lingula anatina]|uniref:Riboflavin transporter n=1 Tax=Lingula anatina TaxID=7574 RepID=A0A1S3K6I1_LINAN|nr:riboflavin transporter 2 [Lingula anatina]XP_013418037.1 riboflavin transporter 2 [Lingula anatina]XP_013418038.1 riboflavin transporter 2 [Lingula anatina]XP_013418039.1 riboflavin transporter 2 [Lingula anatina]XP_013418040.1 riboflavin transporter 2 [Lingula anatina]|eukprot:XP_013418036.1 riboflavin transporter 2 [Lingula anatina]
MVQFEEETTVHHTDQHSNHSRRNPSVRRQSSTVSTMALMCYASKSRPVSIPVAVIVALFGIGSWIAINGLWVELPLLVQRLPESWDLPSYLAVIIQIANLGPIIYTVSNCLVPKRIKEVPVAYVVITMGIVSTFLLGLFWEHQTYIAGVKHSTALLALAFCLAFVDCTSSVLFLPYMAVFKEQYMTAYYIGEGFSGLLPSLVALAQGAGEYQCVNQTITNSTTNETSWQLHAVLDPPNFPIKDFFFFLFAMMLTCGISFTALNYLPLCTREHSPCYKEECDAGDQDSEAGSSSDNSLELDAAEPTNDASPKDKNMPHIHSEAKLLDSNIVERTRLKRSISYHLPQNTFILVLILTGWLNALSNGVFPSIQTYSCLPYGQLAYNLAVKLSALANPLACLIAFFLPSTNKKVISSLVGLATAIGVFIMVTAVMSPHPVMHSSVFGKILIVLAWVLMTAFFSYSKVMIAVLLRDEGRKALLWCGAVTQGGSFIGAVVTFLLVNVAKLFKDAPQCPKIQ